MLFSKKILVLKVVKYNETSLIVTGFHETLGIQSYLVKGARSAGKKSAGKAMLFQPGNFLETIVNQQPGKSLQFLNDVGWAHLHTNINGSIVKNSLSLFIVELLLKSLKQPEENSDLFYFCEDVFQYINDAAIAELANTSLFFALHLTNFLGIGIQLTSRLADDVVFDLSTGQFLQAQQTNSPFVLNHEDVALLTELLACRLPEQTVDIKMGRQKRQFLLAQMVRYFQLHIQDFGTLKTLGVLQEIL